MIIKPLYRHLVVLIASIFISYIFYLLLAQWEIKLHTVGKALADTSLILIALTVALGPAAKLNERFTTHLTWRKELGIWAVIFALAHIYFIFDGWIEWRFAELFGYYHRPGTEKLLLKDPGLAIANIVGIMGTLYGVVLLATSNELSKRLLGTTGWKKLHSGFVQPLYILSLIHTFYFLYFFYYAYPRSTPPPNFFIYLFPALVATVAILEFLAYLKVVKGKS